jgi:hypothetical protein
MSTHPEPRLQTAAPTRRPWFACALQFTFLLGGIGYLVRGEWRRFGVTFAAVAALEGMVFVASTLDSKPLMAVVMPAIFSIQALSALDLYQRGK